jgi:hypothetical protein
MSTTKKNTTWLKSLRDFENKKINNEKIKVNYCLTKHDAN